MSYFGGFYLNNLPLALKNGGYISGTYDFSPPMSHDINPKKDELHT